MDNQTYELQILLATYNGAKYIKEQIESLFKQTYENWQLVIRDDGSTDSTQAIIEEFVKKHPEKITQLKDNEKNLGPSRNFSRLLSNSKANYVMFCDQDDYWKENKIELSIRKIKELEKLNGKEVPILVHTDLEVVDKNLNTISKSMFEYQNLNKEFTSLNNLLVQNNVTGCTTIINRALISKATPIPEKVVMHDWWLGLVASAFGEIGFINESTIRYRQHENNDTGAKSYSLSYLLGRLTNYNFQKVRAILYKNLSQAQSFYNSYENQLDKEMKDMVYNYLTILNRNPLGRLFLLKKYNLNKQGFVRNIGFTISLLIIGNHKVG